jgi:hypothetical protein
MMWTSTSRAQVPVDTELSLLADISTSVDADEFTAQIRGYEAAFRSSRVIDHILAGPEGAIAVNLVLWNRYQFVAVPWTLIDSAAASYAFADAISSTLRPPSNVTPSTFLGSALMSVISPAGPGGPTNEGGDADIRNNGFTGNRLVIDVSGDGPRSNEDPVPTWMARRDVLNAGIDQINGLVVTSPDQNRGPVLEHYRDVMIGGDGAFVLEADFDSFASVLEQKLVYEITNTPEPSSASLLLLALCVSTVLRRRITKS